MHVPKYPQTAYPSGIYPGAPSPGTQAPPSVVHGVNQHGQPIKVVYLQPGQSPYPPSPSPTSAYDLPRTPSHAPAYTPTPSSKFLTTTTDMVFWTFFLTFEKKFNCRPNTQPMMGPHQPFTSFPFSGSSSVPSLFQQVTVSDFFSFSLSILG